MRGWKGWLLLGICVLLLGVGYCGYQVSVQLQRAKAAAEWGETQLVAISQSWDTDSLMQLVGNEFKATTSRVQAANLMQQCRTYSGRIVGLTNVGFQAQAMANTRSGAGTFYVAEYRADCEKGPATIRVVMGYQDQGFVIEGLFLNWPNAMPSAALQEAAAIASQPTDHPASQP